MNANWHRRGDPTPSRTQPGAATSRRSVSCGYGRLIKIHGTNDAEIALVVVDARQGQGLGSELLRRLVQVGRDERLSPIVATIAVDNREMQQVARKIGFTVRYDSIDQLVKAELPLQANGLGRHWRVCRATAERGRPTPS